MSNVRADSNENSLNLIQSNKDKLGVRLMNILNYNYVGTLHVGNPPQKLRVIFDTGSTNQWILSSFCKGPRIESGNNLFYNASKSSTYKPTNIGCEVLFGSGPLRGWFAFDDVRIIGESEDE